MSTIDKTVLTDILDSVRAAATPKVTGYDTVGVVTKIENGQAYVRFLNSEIETPVQMRINAKVGDTVGIRVDDHRAWITGNTSAPPTDDTEAIIAKETATVAKKIADDANETASQAKRIADNTNQYFWFTPTGTDTGAHITEIPQNDFLADPGNGGGNLLARSNGIAIRDGLSEMATFGTDGVQIGQSEDSNLKLDFNSMQLKDKNGYTYFYVSDLRNADDKASIVDKFVGDGVKTAYALTLVPDSSEPITITVGGVVSTDWTRNIQNIIFTTAPSDGDEIIIEYITQSLLAKAYTFGIRESGENIGAMSVSEGLHNVSSGNYSHSEGWETRAESYASHAEGNRTIAGGSDSHAEGYSTRALGVHSHAEGSSAKATGSVSHAEGRETRASGAYSHAEGGPVNVDNVAVPVIASGTFSHAEGASTEASGFASHAQGCRTIAQGSYQTVMGYMNEPDNTSLLVIGNGMDGVTRRNAFTVNRDGNAKVSGTITVQGHAGAIGQSLVVTGGTSGTISVASGSSVPMVGVTFTPGVWLVFMRCVFPANASGFRAIGFSSTSTDSTAMVKTMASPSGTTCLTTTYPLVLASSATYYLIATQGSGSTLNLTKSSQSIRAVRIA